MANNGDLQQNIEKKYKQRDKKIAKPKMKVTGKDVFKLKQLIESKHGRPSKRTGSKGSR